MRARWLPRASLAVLLGLTAAGCGGTDEEPRPVTGPAGGAVILAAGDIAGCETDKDEATARLLDPRATVLALGDLAYEAGSAEHFADCYQPSWGPYRAFTRPVPGNHEYRQPSASPYFEYFGISAGPPGQGWYSFDVGPWHLIALNSNCADVGGCGAGSAQLDWLTRDLAAHPSRCTLAYWHHPRFSSGSTHGGSDQLAPFWDVLFAAGADLVLTGHEHNYERFSPLDPAGQVDPARGVRQFVVGTGGRSLYPFGPAVAGSEFRDGDSFGLLGLVLGDDGYEWQFVSVDGRRVVDSGSGQCH